jgi:hypothetical protein
LQDNRRGQRIYLLLPAFAPLLSARSPITQSRPTTMHLLLAFDKQALRFNG